MMRRFFLAVIRFYRRWISPMKARPTCRFYPTCSKYAYTAISRFGALRGGWLACKRIVKCNPFHPGGIDPVPDSFHFRNSKGRN